MAMISSNEISVILTGLTLRGPDILTQYPAISLTGEERFSIAMKSLPMGGRCGDVVNVSLDGYQIIFVLLSIPAFELGIDQRDTMVSMGILIPGNINPIPFQHALKNIANICKENKLLSITTLENVMKELYNTIVNDKENKFTINVKGNKIDFLLDKGLLVTDQAYKNDELTSSSLIIPVLSKDEILERETNAFIVDKFVLSTIAKTHPITVEEIWKKAIKLEAMIGSRLELNMIIEICKKYIELGIIRKN